MAYQLMCSVTVILRDFANAAKIPFYSFWNRYLYFGNIFEGRLVSMGAGSLTGDVPSPCESRVRERRAANDG